MANELLLPRHRGTTGARRKSIVNKTEDQMLSDVVMPFVSDGIIQLKWGSKTQSYQVIDLRVFRTPKSWDKRRASRLKSSRRRVLT